VQTRATAVSAARQKEGREEGSHFRKEDRGGSISRNIRGASRKSQIKCGAKIQKMRRLKQWLEQLGSYLKLMRTRVKDN
jgi:hypothetical protein